MALANMRALAQNQGMAAEYEENDSQLAIPENVQAPPQVDEIPPQRLGRLYLQAVHLERVSPSTPEATQATI